jgi:hypothetical protein
MYVFKKKEKKKWVATKVTDLIFEKRTNKYVIFFVYMYLLQKRS